MLAFCSLSIIYSCGGSSANTTESSNSFSLNVPSEMSPAEYIQWKKNESKINRVKTVNDIEFHLAFNPKEHMALKELGPNASAKEIRKAISSYEELYYFTLRIKAPNNQEELLKYQLNTRNEYTQRVNYLSFDIQKDVWIVVDNTDTIPCGISHFERAYNVTNFSDILLGFDKVQLNKLNPNWKEITVIYNDKLFNKGIQKFNFDKSLLEETPKLTGI